MSIKKITESIHAVGVLNPALRVFDIVMETKYGTSYNAYVVKGEKTALIETSHGRFFDEYVGNLKELKIENVDYIIFNHTEPDHSGALEKLLKLYPKAKVVSSMAGSLYLKEITNCDFEMIKVKDKDTLDLGNGKVLTFYISPFLHWPDSMFTYLESEKALFTCDFFGAHYPEPRYFDKDVTYKEKYDDAFLYYFNAIFGPFKPFVIKGLEIVKNLKPDFALTSHGPIITKENIDDAVKKYESFCKTEKSSDVIIAYSSAYGCTKEVALEIKEAIEDKNLTCEIYDPTYEKDISYGEKISNAKAFILGSPTINKNAVPPIWNVALSVDAIANKGKVCGVFGSYGWSGEAIPLLENTLKGLGMNVVDTYKFRFVPSKDDLKSAYEFGENIAKAIL